MTEKNKLFFIIVRKAVVVVAFFVAALVVSSFFKNKITKLGDTLSENKKNSAILQKRTEMLQQIEKDMAIIGSNEDKITKAYVPVDNILDFVSAMENLASQNSSQFNLTFGNPIVFSTASSGEKIYTIDYTLSMNGTVYTLANYLKQFNILPFYAFVASVNLSGTAEKGWEGASSISILGKVYARD